MQESGEGAANEVHLIETALPRTLAVQGHGHDHIGGHPFGLSLYYFGQAGSEPGTKRFNRLVFEENDRVRQAALIEAITSRELKAESMALAVGTEGDLFREFRVECPRKTTQIATPRRDPLE